MIEISKLITPVEIDTAINEASFEKYALEARIGYLESFIESYEDKSLYASQVEAKRSELSKKRSELEEAKQTLSLLNLKYAGWARAFLVSNANGHIHSSTSCSTCFLDTKFIWITALSGKSRLEIAELAGEKACSVCYPDAPSEYFTRKCQIEDPAVVEARAEREAKRVEREAKRLATGIWNPDGSELRVLGWSSGDYRDHLKTERTARIWVKDELIWLASSHSKRLEKLEIRNRTLQEVEKVLVAIADKTGQDLESLRSEIAEKANKQILKIQRETEAWLVKNPQYRDSDHRVDYELY